MIGLEKLTSVTGRRILAIGLALVVTSLAACSYPEPWGRGPELHGVTVPLPPPSLLSRISLPTSPVASGHSMI